ncbi:MAG: hypothetical protein ACRCUT_00735, partial [Spirochaetota bacterium]
VDSADAKDALASNMAVLKDAMAQEGLALGAFQVNVRSETGRKPGDEQEIPDHYMKKALTEQELASHEYEVRHASAHDGTIDMRI